MHKVLLFRQHAALTRLRQGVVQAQAAWAAAQEHSVRAEALAREFPAKLPKFKVG